MTLHSTFYTELVYSTDLGIMILSPSHTSMMEKVQTWYGGGAGSLAGSSGGSGE